VFDTYIVQRSKKTTI